MSFESWYNRNKTGWESASSVPSSVTARSNAYTTRNGFPLDFRTLRQTFGQVLSLSGVSRYPGLKVYVIQDDKEYVFKLTDLDTLEMGDSGLKEYHPELSHFYADGDSSDIPADAAVLKERLGNSITIDDTTYNVIPEGAEGTYKTSDGKYHKFVWNGTSWVRFSGTGGAGTVSGPITSSDITDISSDPESDNYPENVCITKRLPKLLFS